jgi:glycogen synthase
MNNIKNIVVHSHAYIPNVGGLENMVSGLVNEWIKAGINVTVYTATTMETTHPLPYKVIRRLHFFELYKAIRKADIFFEANISLKTALLGFLFQKKWFVTHQGTYYLGSSLKQRAKRIFSLFSNNIGCSNFITNNIKGKGISIPNFYNNLFVNLKHKERNTDFVFTGRLVSDKGAMDFLQAFNNIQKEGQAITASIIGDGEEKNNLINYIKEQELESVVSFKGVLQGEVLMQEMNKHKIMVVPTKIDEGFGIVALEGLATGCTVVATNSGGLPEAVGEFGILFQKNDVKDLAVKMKMALQKVPTKDSEIALSEFLKQHTAEVVSKEYLHYFQSKLKN